MSFVGGIGNRQHDLLTEAARAGAEAGHLSTIGPPPDGTVAANAAWYDTLGEREKAWILANKPEMIGNLDGVPAVDRHKANVARVASERTRLQAERDKYPADSQEFKEINDKLAALEAIDLTLDQGGRQLLVLDMTGERAKAAIAIGNVDDADHVAVFTPGVNSTIENGLGGYDKAMNELRDKTVEALQSAGRHESVAVVTWLNYEPPLTSERYGADALSSARATDGANKLAPFLEGINVSRSDDFHLTALGHSYGSLTTGIALRDHPGTGVDDAVFFGSPGIGVDSASELNVPGGHSYNMAAREDPIVAISVAEHYGESPTLMDGMRQLSSDAYTTPDGQHLEGAHGHSEYLRAGDKDTTTEWNMANIIAGTGNVR